MKPPIRHLLLLCCWMLSAASYASAAGIQFTEGSFEAVRAEAVRQGRPIFFDAYAAWCAPCRAMAHTVFSDPAVGDFFNQHFVNYKLDMEKGEGPAIAQRYAVERYPTLMFLDKDGELIDYVWGARTGPQLLQLAERVLKGGFEPLPIQQLKFKQQVRDPDFLYDYLVHLDEAQVPAAEALAAYLPFMRIEEMLSERNWDIFVRHFEDTESPHFQYVAQHHAEFEARYGVQVVADKLGGCYLRNAYIAFDQQDEAGYARNLAAAQCFDSPWVQREVLILELGPLAVKQDWLRYVQHVDRLVAEFQFDDAALLNDFAGTLYKAKVGGGLLAHAIDWSEQAVRQEASYTNLLTQALLFHETGQSDAAQRTAKRALDAAALEGADDSVLRQAMRTWK
jgi:thiol-disulfide isomerase/thioredoxin